MYWIQCQWLYSAGCAVYCFDGHAAAVGNQRCYYSRLLGLLLSRHRSLLLLCSWWPLNLSRCCYSRKNKKQPISGNTNTIELQLLRIRWLFPEFVQGGNEITVWYSCNKLPLNTGPSFYFHPVLWWMWTWPAVEYIYSGPYSFILEMWKYSFKVDWRLEESLRILHSKKNHRKSCGGLESSLVH